MNGRVQRALLLSTLLLAALPLAPAQAGGGCHSAGDELADTFVGTEVKMKRNCFHPAVLAVDEGATVRFSNHDEIKHVVVGTQWGLSDELEPGQAAEHQFLRRGTYPYSCYLHPVMNGVVLVGDPGPVAAAPTAVPAAPAKLAATAASSNGSDLPPLALGALAGFGIGCAAFNRRLRRLVRR